MKRDTSKTTKTKSKINHNVFLCFVVAFVIVFIIFRLHKRVDFNCFQPIHMITRHYG